MKRVEQETLASRSAAGADGKTAESLYRTAMDCRAGHDEKGAFERFCQAGEAGHAAAQFEAGICCVHGRGTESNPARGVHWLRRAAEAGHPGAMDSLGVRYATGEGVPQSVEEAVRWFRRAAELGHRVAQFNMGMAHVLGQGVPQSYVEAYVWFSLSAMSGDEIARESVQSTTEAMSPAELREAREKLREVARQLAALRREAARLAA